MKDYIAKRVKEVALFTLANNCTVRESAKIFKVSKSTIDNDLSIRLEKINPILYKEVKVILDRNISLRSLRGGESTRLKYQNI